MPFNFLQPDGLGLITSFSSISEVILSCTDSGSLETSLSALGVNSTL